MSDASTPAAQATTSSARTESWTATAALWVAGGVALLAPTCLAFFKAGGFTVEWQAQALAVALCALAAAAAFGPWPPFGGRLPVAALVALLALTAWTAVSVAWARVLGDAAHDVVRLSLYSAVFALALAGAGAPRLRRLAPDVLLTGAAVVALYALAGRFLPDLVEQRVSEVAGERLNQPLTYWNALGILMSIGVLLAVAVASDRERPRPWRSVACGLAVPCGVAAYLTFSRGSWIALAVGLVALVLLRPTRATAVAGSLAVGGTLLTVAVLQAFPPVLDFDVDEIGVEGTLSTLLCAAVATICGAAHHRLSHGAAGALAIGPRARAAILTATAIAVVAGGAFVATRGETTENLATGAGRLASVETNRGLMWRVGLDAFREHPLTGIGSASFSVEWTREREEPQRALDAHSLYVETLCELGLVGGLVLLAFAAALVAGLRSAARTRPGDPVLVAAVAVLAAFAVHAGFDWDWEMPAVSLVPLVLAAMAIRAEPLPRLRP
jgi:hypothetical protein